MNGWKLAAALLALACVAAEADDCNSTGTKPDGRSDLECDAVSGLYLPKVPVTQVAFDDDNDLVCAVKKSDSRLICWRWAPCAGKKSE